MSNISDVHGKDFKIFSHNAKSKSTINNLANNIANKQFSMRLHDMNDFWNANHLSPDFVNNMVIMVRKINPKMYVEWIDPNKADINMFPILIENSPVEYFFVVDDIDSIDSVRAYFMYITPKEINTF